MLINCCSVYLKNAFSILIASLFLANSLRSEITSVSNLGTTFVDQNTSGSSWALLGYGANGRLGSLLNAASGSVDTDRQGSATLNSVNFAQQTKSFAISWNQTGFPTGGISSYDHAISFSFSEPSSFTFTAAASPPSGTGSTHWSKVSTNSSTLLVNIEVLKGTPNLPSQMYLRRETFGANSGNSYGLVYSPSNNQLDWSPDGQAFRVIYLGINSNGYIASGAGGTGNGYTPSTMAIWAKMPEDSITPLLIPTFNRRQPMVFQPNRCQCHLWAHQRLEYFGGDGYVIRLPEHQNTQPTHRELGCKQCHEHEIHV